MTATLTRTITEAQMQTAIRQAALANGYLFYHTFRSDRSDPGFPDCICVRDGRLVVMELKAQRGRVSGAQQQWIDAFGSIPNVTAVIVRPDPKPGEYSYDDALELLGGER